MSICKMYVDKLDDVKREYEENRERFIRKMMKVDAFVGNSETIDFIEKIIMENEKKSS